jgi:hypothetical protein
MTLYLSKKYTAITAEAQRPQRTSLFEALLAQTCFSLRPLRLCGENYLPF